MGVREKRTKTELKVPFVLYYTIFGDNTVDNQMFLFYFLVVYFYNILKFLQYDHPPSNLQTFKNKLIKNPTRPIVCQ